MSRLTEWALQFPRTTVSGVILVSVLLGWHIPKIHFEPDMKAMIPQDFPQVTALEEIDELFGGNEIIVVAVASDSILHPGTLEKFRSLHEELEEVPSVDRVLSVYSAKEIISSAEGFEVVDLLEEIPTSAEDRQRLKERIKRNELFSATLFSEELDAMSFMLMLNSSYGMDDLQVRNAVVEIVAKYRSPEMVYIAGLPLTRAAVLEGMRTDMKNFLPYGVMLMILLLALSFRSWMGVFLPLIVVGFSLIWTFGLIGLLGIDFVFFYVLMPVILIAVANDYGIHMVAHYFENLKRRLFDDKMENIRETASSLNKPIVLAGVTTIAGLMSLLGHILPPAQRLGFLAGFGILVAFILSLTFIPAALKLLRVPPHIERGSVDRTLNRILRAWGRFFLRRKAMVVIGSSLLVVLSTLLIPNLVIDTDPLHYYREDAEIRMHSERISDLFGGSTQLSVVIRDDIKNPETLRKMKQLGQFLEAQESVTNVVSIVDQVELMNEAWNEGDPQFKRIPETREVVAAYLELFSLQAGDEEMERLVDVWGDSLHSDGYWNAQVVARLTGVSSATILKLIDDVQAYVDENFEEGKASEVSGPASIVGVLTDLIARGQLRSLAISIVLVFLVTSAVFRSFQAGVYNIIPLGGAVVMVFGLMSLLEIELNAATSMLTSILIGVGVDYTIHFLWHYRRYIRKGYSAEEAVEQTLTTSGKGIIFNALSVMVGFTVLMVSAFLPVYFFGFVIVFSIGLCLFGALAILPALIVWRKPKFIFENNG